MKEKHHAHAFLAELKPHGGLKETATDAISRQERKQMQKVVMNTRFLVAKFLTKSVSSGWATGMSQCLNEHTIRHSAQIALIVKSIGQNETKWKMTNH